MKVLFATDGSRYAEYAEQLMMGLFPSSLVDLSIVSVCPASDLRPIDFDFPPDVLQSVSECRDHTKDLVANAANRMNTWAKSAGTKVLEGHTAQEILKEIDETHPDVCVIGSHGRSAVDRFFLGSVSDKISKHAHASMLLARPHNEDYQSTQCHRILIADDGSRLASRAIIRFAERPSNTKSEIQLVSIVPDFRASAFGRGVDGQELIDEAIAVHKERHKEFTELLAPNAASVTSVVEVGHNVANDIVHRADEFNADLIILGGNEKSTLNRMLLGSVSTSVLHHAHCSVWIERPHHSDATEQA
ncbi:putative universal stress protein [Thalassoglobus neptunius]|uniref:Putative universal stress protein n=1 Tax=Thalassoglobus neptunius TaxID=1938619 RepID=A0A5C5X4R1_9PLAN|nr:universal stress protein [Thalassoglobus neptunius]TWT57718.1 putative universal stress protein [Thalassoglobus neptunius]